MNDTKDPGRKDGRRAMLVYLSPTITLRLKQQALVENRHSYVIVEEMLAERFGIDLPVSPSDIKE